jgi:hypothetical protein
MTFPAYGRGWGDVQPCVSSARGCTLSEIVMAEQGPGSDPNRDREDADRRTSGLAAIVIVLLLLIGGLMLTKTLHDKSLIEDCLMSGRRDCDHLISGTR